MVIKRIGGKVVSSGYPLVTFSTKSEAQREKGRREGKIRIRRSKAGYTLYRYG